MEPFSRGQRRRPPEAEPGGPVPLFCVPRAALPRAPSLGVSQSRIAWFIRISPSCCSVLVYYSNRSYRLSVEVPGAPAPSATAAVRARNEPAAQPPADDGGPARETGPPGHAVPLGLGRTEQRAPVRPADLRLPKVAAVVGAELRRKIVRGELASGHALPSEEQFVDRRVRRVLGRRCGRPTGCSWSRSR